MANGAPLDPWCTPRRNNHPITIKVIDPKKLHAYLCAYVFLVLILFSCLSFVSSLCAFSYFEIFEVTCLVGFP